MSKLEPIEKLPTMPEIIMATEIGGTIDIHATRIASFKSSVSRINKDTGSIYTFVSGDVKDNYITFKRIA